jgi:hypothetical protein
MAPTEDPLLQVQHLLSVSATMPGFGVRIVASLDPVCLQHVEQASEIVDQPVLWIAPEIKTPATGINTRIVNRILADSQTDMDAFRSALPMFYP